MRFSSLHSFGSLLNFKGAMQNTLLRIVLEPSEQSIVFSRLLRLTLNEKFRVWMWMASRMEKDLRKGRMDCACKEVTIKLRRCGVEKTSTHHNKDKDGRMMIMFIFLTVFMSLYCSSAVTILSSAILGRSVENKVHNSTYICNQY